MLLELALQKAYVVDDSDEDAEDIEEERRPQEAAVEEEDEIVESDVELEGETVEPDNDAPQKVLWTHITPPVLLD